MLRLKKPRYGEMSSRFPANRKEDHLGNQTARSGKKTQIPRQAPENNSPKAE